MPSSQLEAKSFIGGLFDFSFTTFITLKFLKVIYGLLVALILLGALGVFFSLVSQGGASILAAFVLVPLGALIYIVFARIYMEIIALFFRIGENTNRIVAHLGTAPTGGADPQAGPFTPGSSGPVV